MLTLVGNKIGGALFGENPEKKKERQRIRKEKRELELKEEKLRLEKLKIHNDFVLKMEQIKLKDKESKRINTINKLVKHHVQNELNDKIKSPVNNTIIIDIEKEKNVNNDKTPVDYSKYTCNTLKEMCVEKNFDIKKCNKKIDYINVLKNEGKITSTKKTTIVHKKLPATVRNSLWNKYKDLIKNKCYCCQSENITRGNFECGHVVSRKNKGSDKIDNLRPICPLCNKSMGTQNMFEFMNTYGYKKLD